MIKAGDRNVSSPMIERAVHGHPDVVRSAVVGLPDEYWSEAVAGFVMVGSGSATDRLHLREHCRTQLANYKVPTMIDIVEELPVDPQGKRLERELRRLHGGVRL